MVPLPSATSSNCAFASLALAVSSAVYLVHFLPTLALRDVSAYTLSPFALVSRAFNSALVATLCPERELVGSALYGIDAPEAFVDERGCGSRFGSNGKLESLALCLVEQTLVDELCLDFCTFLCGSFPGRDVLFIIFEGAVADEFGIETAIGSMLISSKKIPYKLDETLTPGLEASTLMVTWALAANVVASTAESKNVFSYSLFIL